MSEFLRIVGRAIATRLARDGRGMCLLIVTDEQAEDIAKTAFMAIRELPGEPGPRYTAGEYSRRTQEAMVDDALREG